MLVGDGTLIPVVGGGSERHINLDFAASAPALVAVRDAVEEFLPFYSSVHRGAGYKSQTSTRVYEASRREIATFLGAREDDVVVITRNTTDSVNILAAALPDDCIVVGFDTDHHANMLPWRQHDVRVLSTQSTPAETVELLRQTLETLPADRPILVAFTGASNVTGELWPVIDIAAVAAARGARTFLDAAQLSPHAPVDISAWGIDWVAVSGHKLYAPYGAGALVGRRDWLEQRAPMLRGGGAVDFVTTDDVLWAPAPDRQEAGSPNVVGAFALAVACKTLSDIGMSEIAAKEAKLVAYAHALFDEVPTLSRYGIWGADSPRIGVVAFNLGGVHYRMVAAALSAEYGISVRDGCFCAHPLMLRLLAVTEACAQTVRADLAIGSHVSVPGAVRMSTGLTTTTSDIDALASALTSLVDHGPKWSYDHDEIAGRCSPTPDDRAFPTPGGLTF